MHFKEALDYLVEKSNGADRRTINTLDSLYRVLLESNLDNGKRWADKIESVVAYVEAGNYAFCSQEAIKIFNRRKYDTSCARR